MKKIMRKALSLVLALVMVFTLAPMTANAAVGDTVAMPENYIWSGDTVEVKAGETTYFEISGDYGTFDLKVEGAGDFDVAVCTEGAEATDADPYNYKEGAAVSATDGVVVTEITFYEYTWGCGAFSITNNTDADAVYVCTVVYPEGTQGNPKAITLSLDATVTVTVPAYTQYYVDATLPETDKDYQMTITGATGFGYPLNFFQTTWDIDGVITATVNAGSWFGYASLSIINNTDSEQTYTLALANMPLGAQSNPDSLTVGTTVTKELAGSDYWYTWTVTETGTFTLTMDNTACANGWTYDVNGACYSTGWDESDMNVYELPVVAGDVVTLGVWVPTYMADYDAYDVYTPGNGTIVFSTAFAAGTTDGGEGGSEGEDGGEGGTVVGGEEINENYFYNYTDLGVGTTSIMPAFGYPTTLYTFSAEEAGTYTVTLSDVEGKVGYYGSNEWFPYDYSVDTGVANTYTYTLNYIDANAPALIGVSDTMMCDITITRTGDAAEREEILKIDYAEIMMEADPEKYTFNGNVEDLESVIYVADQTAPVMGEDGFYYLVPADEVDDFGEYIGEGKVEDYPLILVKLNDPTVSLVAAIGYGSVNYVSYVDGEPEFILEFNTAIEKYVAASDTSAKLYPLTDDLLVMMVLIGETQNWYGENGFVTATFENDGIAEENMVTFAMYYLEDTGNEGTGDEGTGNEGTGNEGTGNEGTGNEGTGNEGTGNEGTGNEGTENKPSTDDTTKPEAPKTGDATNVVLWISILGLGVVAVASSVVMKKRNF